MPSCLYTVTAPARLQLHFLRFPGAARASTVCVIINSTPLSASLCCGHRHLHSTLWQYSKLLLTPGPLKWRDRVHRSLPLHSILYLPSSDSYHPRSEQVLYLLTGLPLTSYQHVYSCHNKLPKSPFCWGVPQYFIASNADYFFILQ